MSKKNSVTQRTFTKSWFQEHGINFVDNRISCPQLEAGWFDLTGRQFRDPEKMLRSLFAEGFLERHQTKQGSYRYNKSASTKNFVDEFSVKVRQDALDSYGLVCKNCREVLDVDQAYVLPRIPFSRGGLAELRNAQVLCVRHALLVHMMADNKNARRIFDDILEKLAAENGTSITTKYRFLDSILGNAESFLHLKPSNLAGDLKKKR
jgi:hypothetical protein